MGMVNFVNVIFTSIYSRQKELAAMESIGMTKGQLKRMLILEGVYYSILTMVLLLTIGIPASYGVVQLVKNIIYFAAIGVPIVMLAATFLAMLALCAVIPLIVFCNIACKDSKSVFWYTDELGKQVKLVVEYKEQQS